MTSLEFSQLSLDQQESFINNGGTISPSVSNVSEEQKEQAVSPTDTNYTQSTSEVSGFPSEQPASSLSPLRVEIAPAGGGTTDHNTIAIENNVNDFTSVKADEPLLESPHILDTPPVQPPTYIQNEDDGVMISDPVDLLYLVDKDIQSGRVTLHAWQVRFMLDFALSVHNDQFPFQAAMKACNGSGKDKYVIAACAVWICMRYKNTTCPVTSSSGFQLDNQTCKHTRRLCEAVNRYFSLELWDCKYRSYTFRFDEIDNEFNSQILCYATDEPGKAEGFHPVESGKRMAIFLSEDKTIPDDINDAINKCTGYTHRVHASTPGKSHGHFFDYCTMAVPRVAVKSVKDIGKSDWILYHVNSDMCPHLGGEEYKERAARNIPGGRNSPAYKSQVDAEFGGDDGEMTVIPYTYVWQATRNTHGTKWHTEEFNEGGLDLADGGDETALAIRNGNKLLKMIPFKFNNSQDTIAFLIEKFKENGLQSEKALIRGDCVGIGKPILDQLVRMGWRNIRYVDSRAKAYKPTVYKNRNSEIWFHVRRLLEVHALILFEDRELEKQLGSRHYKLMNGKIHQMLSKIEEKKLGFPSPDRADAFNLAFWNYRPDFIELDATVTEESELPFTIEEVEEVVKGAFTLKQWANGDKKRPMKREHDDLSDIREQLALANKQRRESITI